MIGRVGISIVVAVFSEHPPSESAADLVEAVDRATRPRDASVVVAVGVAVVRVALGLAVELTGRAVVRVRVDVVDVALVGGYVAAALVLAVPVANLHSTSERPGERAPV